MKKCNKILSKTKNLMFSRGLELPAYPDAFGTGKPR